MPGCRVKGVQTYDAIETRITFMQGIHKINHVDKATPHAVSNEVDKGQRIKFNRDGSFM